MHDLLRFWRQRPPRSVPLTASIPILLNGWVQVALGIILFTTPFFWVFPMQADLPWINFVGEKAWTDGKVVSVDTTGASENGDSLYEVRYSYLVDREITYEGVGYATGWSPGVGSSIDVEYLVRNPERSRADELRRSMWGAVVLVVLIFPLIGIIFLYFALRSGRRAHYLLRHGVFAEATMVDQSATNTSINNRRVMACRFEFDDRSGRRLRGEVRTCFPERILDGQNPALYDPDNPESMQLVDLLDDKIGVDDNGDPYGKPLKSLLSLILPALVIGANYFAWQLWSA